MPVGYIVDSFEERLEKFHSWQDAQPTYTSKGLPYDPRDNVTAILRVPDYQTETLTEHITYGQNIVTDAGDQYYAERGVVASITNDFTATGGPPEGRMFLRTGVVATPLKTDTFTQVTTPLVGATDSQNLNATFPKVADPDVDNPTPGVVDQMTWTYDWAAGEATSDPTTIKGGAIVNASALPVPAGADALLNHFNFTAAFAKPALATLKVIVNHTVVGV